MTLTVLEVIFLVAIITNVIIMIVMIYCNSSLDEQQKPKPKEK